MDKKSKGFGKIALSTLAVVTIFGGLYWLYKKYSKPEEKKVLKDAYDNLTFDSGKATIQPSSFPFLDEIVNIFNLKEAKDWKLSIAGHTDNQGSKELNNKLSLDRANAVKSYLVSRGIEPLRITAEGFGFSKPIADNTTPEGREKNRRVEFSINKPSQSIIS